MQVEHILPSVAVNPPGPTRDEIAASDILLALRHLPRNKNPWVSLQPKKTIVKGAHRGTFRRVKTVGVDTQAGTRRSGPLCERRDGPARDSPLKPSPPESPILVDNSEGVVSVPAHLPVSRSAKLTCLCELLDTQGCARRKS